MARGSALPGWRVPAARRPSRPVSGARVARLLKVRPGEGRVVARQAGLMLCAATGGSVAVSSADALLLTNIGVQILPWLYVALGLVSVLLALGLTVLLARLGRERYYGALPVALACGLAVDRAVLAVG